MSSEAETSVQGHVDLASFYDKKQCECLNESDENGFKNCLTNSPSYLESDCDEQLIISISFMQPVKIHSIKLKADKEKGPKTIKLFINRTQTLDFDSANSYAPVQELILTPSDLEGKPINLKFVKFQNVQNIQLFIKDNQSGSEATQIEYLSFIGSAISTTKMGDFKRVAGKKGESH
ncbi:thioredoxin-like protein 1 [Schistocerca serialis cubense]|uniref:thioredoxin-like protein 1 n=1 Tax=Schistocerca serialis cubense TaxID=2023355 RepID=UPI00214F2865|nr:thioredoxin-like protein 1 [Schistocerca serialis cubense]XP_049955102.1 thioredoxin-like protein 1 [Schistocerca serialis cubense]